MSKIFDFVKPGVITGDDVQKVFAVAKENNFALPAVNCVGTDSINAVLEAAAKVRAPVIVQFSNGGAAFIAGKGVKTDVPQGAAILGAISGAHHVHQMAEHYGVPVILHTDHCAKKLLPWLDGLLDAGEKHFAATGKPLFSSHMIDLSEESLEENIEICSAYLKRMAKIGMTLEIELNMADVVEQAAGIQRHDHRQGKEQQAVDELRQGAVAGEGRDAEGERNIGGSRGGEQRTQRQIADGRQQQAGCAADGASQQADAAADARQRDHGNHRQGDGGHHKTEGGRPQMLTGLQPH